MRVCSARTDKVSYISATVKCHSRSKVDFCYFPPRATRTPSPASDSMTPFYVGLWTRVLFGIWLKCAGCKGRQMPKTAVLHQINNSSRISASGNLMRISFSSFFARLYCVHADPHISKYAPKNHVLTVRRKEFLPGLGEKAQILTRFMATVLKFFVL